MGSGRTKLTETDEHLVRVFEEFDTIDAHEHLSPEKVRLEQNVDALTLFGHYTRTDLITAGMSAEIFDRIHDPNVPLDERWRAFSPHLKNIRYGSYARPAFIAAKEFYGFDDIDDDNYKALSEKMSAENRPGIYRRILRDKCRIRVALTQANRTDYDLDLLVPVMPLDTYADLRSGKAIEELTKGLGAKATTLDDYVDLVREGLKRWKSQGVVGIKTASRPYAEPDRGQALALFDSITRGDETLPELNPLRSYVMEQMLDMAPELGLVVAVHTGMWGDFRELDPKHMIRIIMRHPKTKFDLYHMGMPWVRETGIMGKNFPNVWLNLCWCHIISPKMTRSALDEWVDLVPINKIIAFGGDYGTPVEKVYGHLVMAREDIAKVLGGRIMDGLMTEDEAIYVAERWFHHNPKELYQLNV